MTVAINLINGPKVLRDTYISNTEVLDKVKHLSLLPDKQHMTLRQVAEYFEIDIEVVRKTIQRHREELNSDGMVKLSGKQLDKFKSELPYNVPELHKVPSTQLLPRRAILRMGMLLKNSKVAEKVRTYLLEAESQITSEQKRLIFQGSWTEEIDQFIIGRVIEDEKGGIRFNDTLRALAEEIHATVHQIKNYWYVGGQGKDPLRNRMGLRVITNHAPVIEETPQTTIDSKQFDLFTFANDQERNQLLNEQNNMIKLLLSEIQSLRDSQKDMTNFMGNLQSIVVNQIQAQEQVQQDHLQLKGLITELHEIAQNRNQAEVEEVERKYAMALKKLKNTQKENEDIKKDMNDLIHRAGVSVLLGDFNTEFSMDRNGNLERK